jgi:hypothetical protein
MLFPQKSFLSSVSDNVELLLVVIGVKNHIFQRGHVKERKEASFGNTLGYTYRKKKRETYAIRYKCKGEKLSHTNKVFVK